GIYCAHALANKAGGTDAKKCMAASEGLSFPTAAGSVTMRGRHVDKTMYLATCKGTEFDIIKTFADVKSGRVQGVGKPDAGLAATSVMTLSQIMARHCERSE